MLTAHHLYKSYGVQPVLQDISFSVSGSERVGLIGPNGCGKSTLLRILAGIEKPDRGSVALTRPGLRIGYLAQGLEPSPDQTIQSTLGLASVSTTDLETELSSLAASIAADPENTDLQSRYDDLLAQISAPVTQPATVLAPLGLAGLPIDTPVAHLSGGQKTRLMLAKILLDEPHLLLLDEPTNHLDVEMLEWLEDWLATFRGAALIVSHDRAFLDNTVTRILEMDPGRGLHEYTGNYSDYFEQRQEEITRQWDTYADQQAEIRRVRQDIARTKEQSRQVERSTTPRQPGVRRIAKKVARKALSREKKLERYVESDERVERPQASWQLKLEFSSSEALSRSVLTCENLSIGYSPDKPLLTGIDLTIRAGERVALTGANGSGKTTLLRTLGGELPPLAGSFRLGQTVRTGYMTQGQESLDLARSPLDLVQRTSGWNQTEARHFLHFFLFAGDDPLRPCGEMSYGERTRLQLALLVAGGCTFLILDEPLNHLDIPSRARFEQALAGFKGTVLAVVHDRYFITQFATQVWRVNGNTLYRDWSA
jgi:ATP-binding cassette subfamily F protein 3